MCIWCTRLDQKHNWLIARWLFVKHILSNWFIHGLKLNCSTACSQVANKFNISSVIIMTLWRWNFELNIYYWITFSGIKIRKTPFLSKSGIFVTQTFKVISIPSCRMAGWDSRQFSWKKDWQQQTSIMAIYTRQCKRRYLIRKDYLSVEKRCHIRRGKILYGDTATLLFFGVNTAHMAPNGITLVSLKTFFYMYLNWNKWYWLTDTRNMFIDIILWLLRLNNINFNNDYR